MKNLFLILFLTLACLVLVGCEPSGGGPGYQYLGRLSAAQINCDSEGDYTTSLVVTRGVFLTVNRGVFKVVGKVEFRKALHSSFVWVNLSKKVLRLREGDRSFEYSLLEYRYAGEYCYITNK